jgi:hypothetical protein
LEIIGLGAKFGKSGDDEGALVVDEDEDTGSYELVWL